MSHDGQPGNEYQYEYEELDDKPGREVEQIPQRPVGASRSRTGRMTLIVAGIAAVVGLIVVLWPYIVALIRLACYGI